MSFGIYLTGFVVVIRAHLWRELDACAGTLDCGGLSRAGRFRIL